MDTDNQGVGVETPEGSAALASPSNEQSATDTTAETNTVVDATPGASEPGQEKTGEGVDPSQPVDLTEQELTSLPPKTAQAFARFRTENKGLQEENTTLKQQLSEFQSQASPTTPAIAVDKPVDEWDGLGQFESLPAPYKEKLGEQIGWQRLPDLLSRAAENLPDLPREWQDAIATPILKSIGAEFGLTPQGVIQAIQAGIGQLENGGGVTSPVPTAQSSQSQLAKQLIETGGYESTDPLVMGVAGLEREFASLKQQNAALLSRLDKHDQQVKETAQQQQERAQRELESNFQSKVAATWETILGPTLQTIPKGYERWRKSAEVEAKDTVANDSVASTHLANAKAAMLQAQKYRQQGTPDLAKQAEDKQGRELTAYAARCAVVSQSILKDLNALITENISLKNGTIQQQQQRKDLVGGGGGGNGGNGFQPRQPGEDLDAYLERAKAYRHQETALLDSQR